MDTEPAAEPWDEPAEAEVIVPPEDVEAADEPEETEAGPLEDPHAFGPLFFLTQLRAFVRDRCPRPEEELPVVTVRLATGESLDLCHVVGVGPRCAVLAVHDRAARGGDEGRMRTEFVPYGLIARVAISARGAGGSGIGFQLSHEPTRVGAPAEGAPAAERALLDAAASRATP